MLNLAEQGGLTATDLATRRRFITATDASKIMGTSPENWGNKYDVYIEKTIDQLTPRDDSMPMLWGRMMEPVLLSFAEIQLRKFFNDDKLKLTKAGTRRKHANLCMSCTLDAIVKGHRAAIEAKTQGSTHGFTDTSAWGEEEWSDLIPPHYLDQVLHQLACAPDLDRIFVILSISRQVPKFYCVERVNHTARIAAIENACCDFMEQHIIPQIPPDDVAPLLDTLRRVQVPANPEVVVELRDEELEVSKRSGELISRLKKRKDKADAAIKARMIGAMSGRSPSGHRATLTTINRKGFTVAASSSVRLDVILA